ncbi:MULTISPECIES: endospore germination permease [unclassified Paenibacillus]|uniref:GerAB/ArcD/ProY family transporter n=1 Tax=unclassified Paenibacillus TaxID=185978 RepID=UPI001C1269AA|nr:MULTISPECIES: endospore germination permease [unclassified Paenibacillus]MBU5444881.1 spore germination protein [Paenibacillus sp. MSJ-34]CAH0121765.1 Spore germination protein YndE [Paenibacillus sp. CECT 9249]
MKNVKITFMQYTLLIHGAAVGMGVLSLPRLVAEKAGTDGWISILLAWLAHLFFGILIVLVMSKYPQDSLPELLVRLFGRFLGKLLLIPIVAYFAFFSWSILVNSILFIKSWFFPMTPAVYIMILFAVPTYIIVAKNLQIVGRYAEIVFYLTIWMSLILLIPLRDGQLIHLLPVWKSGLGPILDGVTVTTNSIVGYEIVYFIYPYLTKKEWAVRGVVLANTLTMLVYLFITLICFVYFSPNEITEYNQPVLNLLKVIEFRFLERFDMIYLAVYLIVVSTAWTPYLFGAAFGTARLFGSRNHGPAVALFLIAMIVMSYVLQPSWAESERWTSWAVKGAYIVVCALPVFLFLYIMLHRKLVRSGG